MFKGSEIKGSEIKGSEINIHSFNQSAYHSFIHSCIHPSIQQAGFLSISLPETFHVHDLSLKWHRYRSTDVIQR